MWNLDLFELEDVPRLIEKELCRRKEIDDQKETKRKELDRLRLQRKLVKIEKELKRLG